MALLTLCLALAGALSAAEKAAGWAWHTTTSPHFEVSHEMSWMPPGFIVSLEKIHSRLRMDLAAFTPWMAKERVKVFLYKDQASYLRGEFQPPSWSDGLALYSIKAVAVPDRPDRRALMKVLAHEATHLFFRSYFQESKRDPPDWLNEGLAMLEEEDPREFSERYIQMAYTQPSDLMPIEAFFKVKATEDLHSKKSASNWYVQAYSVVRFLHRSHSKLQFKAFCSEIRDGKSAEEALWLVYRYRKVGDFQRSWTKWLFDPQRKREAEKGREALAASGALDEQPTPKEKLTVKTLKLMGGFKSLRDSQ